MDGLKLAAKRGTWQFDVLALRLMETRGGYEREIARAIITDPAAAIAATDKAEINSGHFQVCEDARLIFIAADVGRHLERQRILRVAYRLLMSEGEPEGAAWLAEEVANTAPSNPFLMFIGTSLICRDLLAIDAAIRDAQEHYRHACRLLERRVVA